MRQGRARQRFARPTIERLEGRAVPATFTVTSPADAGDGTLRQAILDANAGSGADTIAFNLGGTGVRSIRPATPLPILTDPVTIDGSTQPGYAGVPLVELDGSALAGDAIGLHILGADSTVRGLTIHGFRTSQVTLDGPGGDRVEGSILGLLPDGTLPAGPLSTAAVQVLGPNNTIGGTFVAARNRIGGAIRGVSIEGVAASGNAVQGNLIGVDYAGTTLLGRPGAPAVQVGVAIINAGGNVVGGTDGATSNRIGGASNAQVAIVGAPSTSNRVQGNRIGGTFEATGSYGVVVTAGAAANLIGGAERGSSNVIASDGTAEVLLATGATANAVQGNLIGTDPTGMLSAARAGSSASGIVVVEASGNLIGGVLDGSSNLISGNVRGDGLQFVGDGASGNLAVGNYIGTTINGTGALGNAVGVRVLGPGNILGGAVAGVRNLIAGNLGDGIVFGIGTAGSAAQGNLIGLDASGLRPLGNGGVGVRLVGSQDVLIGGNTLASHNIISANRQGGIVLQDGQLATAIGTLGVRIQGNFIGTDAPGLRALGNGGDGILLTGSTSFTTIGGTDGLTSNLISANGGAGILLTGARVSSNTLSGNLIGTDQPGSLGLGNAGDGIRLVGGTGNVVGGPGLGAGNLVAASGGNGIVILASRVVVQGNIVGTDTTRSRPLGNRGVGLLVQGDGNVIGGAVGTQHNIIVASGSQGVIILPGTAGAALPNRLQGNLIGVGVTGAAGLGNAGYGLMIISAPGTVVGGVGTGLSNVISGNAQGGVAVVVDSHYGPTASGVLVQGNLIGTDGSGSRAVPNRGPGVLVGGSGVAVGGSARGAGNVISGNTGAGVMVVAGAAGTLIQSNVVGTDASGNNPLGNGGAGVFLSARSTMVGGSTVGLGNIIAYNGGPGVFISRDAAGQAGVGNAVLSNFLYSNGGAGIALEAGANGSPVAPTIASVSVSSGLTTIRGTLRGRANTAYLIQLYLNPNGRPDGRLLLGTVSATADAAGNVTFSAISRITPAPGSFVTATATDPAGNSSAFSTPAAANASAVA